MEIPKRVKRDLKFVFVDRMDEVLPVALLPETGPETTRKAPTSQPN
jgi:ATP-dependent Lon protease